MPRELGAETVNGLLMTKNVDGRAYALLEDPVELLNGIALPRAATGDTGKRKSQELEALEDSPGKPIKGADRTLNTSNRDTTAQQSRTATDGKLGRVIKSGRHLRRLNQINYGPKGNIYTVPDFPVVKDSEGAGVTSSTARVDQSTKEVPKRQKQPQQKSSFSKQSHSVSEQPKTNGTSNRSSSGAQTSNIGKTMPKMSEVEDGGTVPPRQHTLKGKPQTVRNAEKQAQSNKGMKPPPAYSTRNLRSRAAKVSPQRAELSEADDSRSRRLSHSSDGGKVDDRLAEENVGDAHNDEDGLESNEHPDGHSDGGQDYDNNDNNNEDDHLCSDELEQNDLDHGVADSLELDSVENKVHTEIELFSQDDSWAIVLDGVDEVVEENLKVETREIRDMISLVKKVKRIYKDVLPYQAVDHGVEDEAHKQLIEGLGQIREKIERDSEKPAGDHAREVLQDIYANAIPNLIGLLEVALRCRTQEYSNIHDIKALREIVRLQNDIVTLCEKVRKWKIKPMTGRPIIRPTSRKILPYLRDVRKAFQNELEERKHQIILKRQPMIEKKLRKERDEKDRQRKEETARLKEERRREIAEDLRRDDATLVDRGRTNPSSNDTFRFGTSQSRQPPTLNDWTPQQDQELLQRLQWKSERNLPGSYLNPHVTITH